MYLLSHWTKWTDFVLIVFEVEPCCFVINRCIGLAYCAVILIVLIACACYRRGWRWYIVDCCRGIPFKLENEAVSHVLLLYYSCAANPTNPTKPLRTLQMLVELTPCASPYTNRASRSFQQFNLIKLDSLNTVDAGSTVNFDSLFAAGEPCTWFWDLQSSRLFRHRQLLSRNIYA